MHIGHVIDNVRRKRGYTQTHLAEKAGITQTFLSLVESGKKEASTKTLESLANALGVPLEVLLLLSLKEKTSGIADESGDLREAQALINGLLELYGEKS